MAAVRLAASADSSVAQRMRGYRGIFGIVDATIPGIESFGRGLIATLEAHLSAHDFQ